MFQTVKSPSSRGLGHCPFTAATGVRIPLGTLINYLNIITNRAYNVNYISLLEMIFMSIISKKYRNNLNNMFR